MLFYSHQVQLLGLIALTDIEGVFFFFFILFIFHLDQKIFFPMKSIGMDSIGSFLHAFLQCGNIAINFTLLTFFNAI